MFGRLRYHRAKKLNSPLDTHSPLTEARGIAANIAELPGVGNKVPQDLREKLASDCAKGVFE